MIMNTPPIAHRIPLLLLLVAVVGPRSAGGRVEDDYRQHCAVCHGEKLDNGLGGSLVDGQWRHGGSSEDIFRSIVRGHPDMNMPAMRELLSDKQIHALVVYIREQGARVRPAKVAVPRTVPEKPVVTQHHSYRMEVVVARGLELPWDMAFLPDGRMLVTERPGGLRLVSADGILDPVPVRDTPRVLHHGQGGMMAIALHPDYARNGWVYLGFSEGLVGKGKRCLTAIVRGRLKKGRWVDPEWIWRGAPEFYTPKGVHFGTRIVFQDGHIFFIVGERGGGEEAQDLARPNGKVFRLRDDGSQPDADPFSGQGGAVPGIWTYGHRNPQGMAIDPRNGDIYVTEHGPRGGDELNRLTPGANYGWPLVTHGMNYNGTPITDKTGMAGVTPPVLHWTPSIAPCGLAFYTGARFPRWRHDLFAGSLRNETLRRLRIRERKVVQQEIILKDAGRIRQVVTGPDGFLYVALNGPDRIVRLVPAE